MSCLDSTLASEFIEDLLNDAEAARIEAHLPECTACRELLAVLAVQRASSQAEASIEPRTDGGKQRAPSAFLEPGTHIGRFIVRESIGRGGMGVVYRAHDPELNRAVAIKLLQFNYSGDRASEAEARFLREARAMARLSHPNVVTVYEAGSENGFVFIAMELLGGDTLDQWLKHTSRSSGEIVATFAGAGKGLHAAHQAGLVHRDFKPTNVVVDENGNAVVLDFGLVAGEELESDDDVSDPHRAWAALAVSSSSASGNLTRTGTQLGTPKYMSPEQHLGEPALASSDQWAFSACLYEALTGRHPFAGKTVAELRKNVLAAKPAPLPKRIPRAIRRATLRGLCREKADRFASMAPLVRTLEGRRARVWPWLLVALALAASAAAIWFRLATASDVCAGSEARVADVWHHSARSGLEARFAELARPFAPRAKQVAVAGFDDYFKRWKALHRETCRAARVHNELAEPAMDRAMVCLDDRMRQATALLAVLLRADRTAIANSEQAILALDPPADCRDRVRLAQVNASAPGLEDETRLDGVKDSVAAVKALIDVGRVSDGLEKAKAAQTQAKTLDYPPATASVHFWLGRANEAAGLYAAADEALKTSVYAAQSAGDDVQLIRAATVLVRVAADRRGDSETGELWYRLTKATLARGRNENATLGRNLDAARARLLAAAGNFTEAEAIARAVLESVRADYGDNDVRVAVAHTSLGRYCADGYNYECGDEQFRRALAIFTEHFGQAHPAVAGALDDLGTTAASQGHFEKALTNHRRAIDIRKAGLTANHPELGASYHNIAYPLIATGKLDEALEACRKAIAINQASFGMSHPRAAATHYTMGYLHWAQKDYELSIESHQRALAIQTEVFGAQHTYVADIHVELGRTRNSQARYADAAQHYATSLAIRRKELGEDAERTVYSMTDLAAALVDAGTPEPALPHLETARAHWRGGAKGDPSMLALNSFTLARALWTSGGKRSRARRLASEALASYEKTGDVDATDRVKRWIRGH